MLRLKKLTDYAMLILSQLARDPGAILSAASIAESLLLSAPTVSKILKMLSDADLVTSVRGADGGYRLARAAEKISLTDVITAMEGHVAMTECCESAGLCTIDSQCAMKENWRRINHMVYTLLADFSVQDMLKPIPLARSAHGK